MQGSDVKIGMLFKYINRLAIHDDVDGHVGVVLEQCNARQWKVLVSHKTLWVTAWHMEVI